MKRASIFILLFSCLFVSAALSQSAIRMNTNQRLDKGQKIEVPGKAYLTMQTDGNLVLYNAANQPKWSTGTNGKTVTHAIMQTDGNLCLYNNSTYVWDAKSANIGAQGGYFEIDPNTFKVAVYKTNGTEAKVLQAGTGTPPASGGNTVDMFFENSGIKPVEIWRATETGVGTKVTDIGNHGRVTIPVKLGDQFVVKIDGSFDNHPKIVISNLESSGVVIHGNKPLERIGVEWSLPDYYPNFIGVDLKVLNPRDLVATINKGKIFEQLNPVGAVDYTVIGNKAIKYGFLFYGLSTAQGSNDVQMTYGFEAFSNSFSASLGGTVPLPKNAGTASLNVGFNHYNQTERSSTNVYAFTKEQKQTFGVDVDPYAARLDPVFKLDALKIKTAADAQTFIQKYGTHYPKTVIYGGDRSVYMVMKKEDFSKVKSFGVDVKAKVKLSKDGEKGKTDNYDANGNLTGSRTNYGNVPTSSGSLGFAWEQNEEVRSAFERTTSKYRQIGGTGGFDNWNVSEDDAAPVNVSLGLLSDLIDIKVFKDGTNPAQLKTIQALVEQAITTYLGDMMKLEGQKPAPVVYEVELKSFEVTKANDDGNKGLRGVTNAYFKLNGAQEVKNMWQQDTYVDPWSTLCFCPGKPYNVPGGKKVYYVHYPESNGTFNPLQISVNSNFWEMDDLLWDNSDELKGATGFINMPNLNDGQSFEGSYTAYHDGNTGWNSILVKYKITRLPTEFAQLLN